MLDQAARLGCADEYRRSGPRPWKPPGEEKEASATPGADRGRQPEEKYRLLHRRGRWLLDAHQGAAGALAVLDQAARQDCADEYTEGDQAKALKPPGEERKPPSYARRGLGRQSRCHLLQRRGQVAAERPPRRGGRWRCWIGRPGWGAPTKFSGDPGQGPGNHRARRPIKLRQAKIEGRQPQCRLLQRRDDGCWTPTKERGGSAGGAGSGGPAGVPDEYTEVIEAKALETTGREEGLQATPGADRGRQSRCRLLQRRMMAAGRPQDAAWERWRCWIFL
ncbi:MAG: hypothetical protein R3F40_09835 [Candidatus Competibacteraceae bacterium]